LPQARRRRQRKTIQKTIIDRGFRGYAGMMRIDPHGVYPRVSAKSAVYLSIRIFRFLRGTERNRRIAVQTCADKSYKAEVAHPTPTREIGVHFVVGVPKLCANFWRRVNFAK